MSECLSCSELEQKICDLSDEIAAAGCSALVTKEGDTTFDHTAALESKVAILKVYADLFKMKKCGASSELYEFVHVPCVQPAVCVGDSCRPSIPSIRNQRRYRR